MPRYKTRPVRNKPSKKFRIKFNNRSLAAFNDRILSLRPFLDAVKAVRAYFKNKDNLNPCNYFSINTLQPGL